MPSTNASAFYILLQPEPEDGFEYSWCAAAAIVRFRVGWGEDDICIQAACICGVISAWYDDILRHKAMNARHSLGDLET